MREHIAEFWLGCRCSPVCKLVAPARGLQILTFLVSHAAVKELVGESWGVLIWISTCSESYVLFMFRRWCSFTIVVVTIWAVAAAMVAAVVVAAVNLGAPSNDTGACKVVCWHWRISISEFVARCCLTIRFIAVVCVSVGAGAGAALVAVVLSRLCALVEGRFPLVLCVRWWLECNLFTYLVAVLAAPAACGRRCLETPRCDALLPPWCKPCALSALSSRSVAAAVGADQVALGAQPCTASLGPSSASMHAFLDTLRRACGACVVVRVC